MSALPFTLHGPSEEGFAEGLDGTRIHYEIWSPPPGAKVSSTLVLSDGIGCDGYVWKYLVPQLAPEHRIVHWQYRGHGKSGLPRDRSHTSFEDICSDMQAVLHATQVSHCVLVGHSMGVQVCLEYQRLHPQSVEAMVLLCGSHGLPLDTFHDTRILRTAVPLALAVAERFPRALGAVWRAISSNELTYQMATHLEVNGRLMSRADFHPYFDHLAGLDPQLFLSMLTHAGEHSSYEYLPDIDIPTLIIAGTKDTFTPYWLSEEMHDRIPRSQMLTVPGGTHTAPLEQPELVALRVEKFFAELAEKRGGGASASHVALA